MRRNYDGFAVLDVWLESLQPVCPGSFEAIESQDSFATELVMGNLIGFERAVELPSLIGGEKIVRRDEDLVSIRLRGLEDALHILDRVVFLKTFVEQRPTETVFTQHVVLRVDKHYCRVVLVEVHNSPLITRFPSDPNHDSTRFHAVHHNSDLFRSV